MYSVDNELSPDKVPFFTKNKLIWVCSKGHKFTAIPRNLLSRKTVCDLCRSSDEGLNLKEYCISKGKDKLLSMYLESNICSPDEINADSKEIVKWRCENGHEFSASPSVMIKRVRLCLLCNKSNVSSFVDYCKSNGKEFLLSMYCVDNDIPVEKLSASDKRLFKWKCEQGHISTASVYDMRRRNRYFCPKCKSSIAEMYPQYAKYWDEDENKVSAKDVPATYIASHCYHWKCPNGHKWSRKIQMDIPEERFCPICYKKSRLLINAYPEVAKIWDRQQNKAELSEITIGNSSLKVYWKCSECGKIFCKTVKRQIPYGSLCSDCFAKHKKGK